MVANPSRASSGVLCFGSLDSCFLWVSSVSSGCGYNLSGLLNPYTGSRGSLSGHDGLSIVNSVPCLWVYLWAIQWGAVDDIWKAGMYPVNSFAHLLNVFLT